MNNASTPELNDLHAYVDGQLAQGDRDWVEGHLAQDEESRERVRDYQALREGLRALYNPVLDEPVPAHMFRPRRKRWFRPMAAVAAGFVLMITGSWIGWSLKDNGISLDSAAAHIVQEAASAYEVFAPEITHPVEVFADRAEHLVAWLSKRLGAAVIAPTLNSFGYDLLGGRLLSTEDGPGALFLYEDPSGQRIAFYMCENETDGSSSAFRFGRQGDIAVFYWFDGPFSYALAGELEREPLRKLAEAVYHDTMIARHKRGQEHIQGG